MKSIALICAYNEEKNIKNVVNSTFKHINKVVVVNDGSTDNTLKEIRKTKATVINNKTNFGKGIALRKGFEYCLKNNYDVIITLDGDGQHNPKDIPKLLDKIKDYDIVVGRRMKRHSSMPMIRRLSNILSSLLITLFTRLRVKDVQSGFRAIKSEVLDKIKLKSKRYDLETELLVKASKKGYNIGETNVKTIYGDEVSYIRPWKDTMRFLRILAKSLFW